MKILHNSLLISITVFCFMSCWENDCPGIFYIPFETIPYQRTYKVGDTITVRSRFHKMVDGYNSVNEKVGTYDMTGIEWRPLCNMVNIDSAFQYYCLNNQVDAYVSPKYSEFKLTQFSMGYALSGEFNFEDDHFKLEFKLIPKVPGKFFMVNHSVISVSNPQSFPGICGRNGWVCYWNMNKGKDNNQDLLDNAPSEVNARYGTGSKPFFWDGNFCFEVVE